MGATLMAILMTIVPQAKAQSCGLDADACHADFTPYTAVVMKRALLSTNANESPSSGRPSYMFKTRRLRA